MKHISVYILLLIVSSNVVAQQDDIVRLREICFKAFREKDPTGIINEINQFTNIETPIINAYKSIVLLLEAKDAFSPFKKIKYFNEGKNLMENSIVSDTKSVELRFLRFCVQTNLPFYLGYSGNIVNDKNFILHNWSFIKDRDLKERIRTGMINSNRCNEIEKGKFNNG